MVTVGMVLVTLLRNANRLEDLLTTPAPIHPSLPLARWITTDNRGKWEDPAIFIAMPVVVFPGGFGWVYLHEMVWDAAGADRPFSFLLAIAALLVALAALLALAWFAVTAGLKARFTHIAEVVAAVAVAGTTIIPAVIGTTSVLNGIGFALTTMVVYAVWLGCALTFIGAWRIKRSEHEVPGDTE
jgi:hypothetical protein